MTPGRRDLASDGPFATVPFNTETCTLVGQPTADRLTDLDKELRASGSRAHFWESATSADLMLELLRTHPEWMSIAPEGQLRRFALKCLDGTTGASASGVAHLVDAVARRISNTTTLAHLDALQRSIHPMVSPAGVQGLPRCNPHAAGLLAAWHTATPNPYDAAFWTAEFAARHDAFVVLRHHVASWRSPDDRGEHWRVSWRTASFARAHPDRKSPRLNSSHGYH